MVLSSPNRWSAPPPHTITSASSVLAGGISSCPGGRLPTGSRPDRDELAADLKSTYEGDKSIRALAEETGRSYGGVQRLLEDTGARFRSRGGAPRRTKSRRRTGPFCRLLCPVRFLGLGGPGPLRGRRRRPEGRLPSQGRLGRGLIGVVVLAQVGAGRGQDAVLLGAGTPAGQGCGLLNSRAGIPRPPFTDRGVQVLEDATLVLLLGGQPRFRLLKGPLGLGPGRGRQVVQEGAAALASLRTWSTVPVRCAASRPRTNVTTRSGRAPRLEDGPGAAGRLPATARSRRMREAAGVSKPSPAHVHALNGTHSVGRARPWVPIHTRRLAPSLSHLTRWMDGQPASTSGSGITPGPRMTVC